jgi:RNA polymerase sigma-70 factor, ECF subfamily
LPARHSFLQHRWALCKKIPAVATTSSVRRRDDLYQQAASEFGPAIARLARCYEADMDKRRDLLQEIHLSLWRSFDGFNGSCSMRTWVYRVAHNAATSYVIRQRRARPQILVGLDEVDAFPVEPEADKSMAVSQLTELIQRLKPLDRQVILTWLDGMDAAEISELTGLSSGNVATKVHRIKSILAQAFQGVRDGRS